MLRRSLAVLVFSVMPAVAHAAEPLTMFLLDLLRQQIMSSIESSAAAAQREREMAASVPRAPYDLEDQRLRALIDEGFVHLTPAQREEVFAGVKRALADPKNAHLRPMIVQELALKASAVRQAHERLADLSVAEKHAIAAQAREEYEKLAPAEREQMLAVLRAGVVPIPRDLSQIILAEFSAVPPPAPAAAAAGRDAAAPQAN